MEMQFYELDALQNIRVITSKSIRAALKPSEKIPLDHDVHSIEILEADSNKFEIVRLVRDLANKSLLEAKQIVDNLPCRLSVTDVISATEMFSQAGAVLAIRKQSHWRTCKLPTAIFDCTPNLKLLPEYELWSHVYSTSGGSNGFITVRYHGAMLPEDFEPEPDRQSFDLLGEAVVGDGSLESYLQASILIRELAEAGADWHGITWGAHKMVDRVPDDQSSTEQWVLEPSWQADWEAMRSVLGDGFSMDLTQAVLRPSVCRSHGSITVRFFTLDPVGRRKIFYHSDVYSSDYHVRCDRQCVAIGGQGYVF